MATIMIVDDEADVRLTLVQALSNAGHTCLEAADGVIALRTLETIEVDVLVTDILMPNRDGLETVMAARASRPELKIVAISGGGRMKSVQFLEVAQKLGADAYLRKPFRPSELTRVVEECLAARSA